MGGPPAPIDGLNDGEELCSLLSFRPSIALREALPPMHLSVIICAIRGLLFPFDALY
jgi:hypothetical protein